MRDVNLNMIEDEATRDAIEAILESIREDTPILKGDWEFFEYEIDAAGTFEKNHGLTFVPNDYLITYDTAGSSINYNDADEETFSFTTTSSGILRLFIGRYQEEAVT